VYPVKIRLRKIAAVGDAARKSLLPESWNPLTWPHEDVGHETSCVQLKKLVEALAV
jgi:hypothetical protein